MVSFQTEVSNPGDLAECFGRNPAEMKAADSYAIAALMERYQAGPGLRNAAGALSTAGNGYICVQNDGYGTDGQRDFYCLWAAFFTGVIRTAAY